MSAGWVNFGLLVALSETNQRYVIAAFAFLTPSVAAVVSYHFSRKKIQEIHLLVDGRLDAALLQISGLEYRLDHAKGDPPGTAAAEAGPAILGTPYAKPEE